MCFGLKLGKTVEGWFGIKNTMKVSYIFGGQMVGIENFSLATFGIMSGLILEEG
ncbi:hypothetical protein [Mangrovibacterium diazotrophicum]|uniref:Uncharacterized protein n=1 Tax=Mangrovibacterium diazotrophicum TaxID=1261403 RepID=A0A419WAG6_9BACT|nr:hypothetical protein [Mangrovibacterium diazotrophicum]RKD92447.1 hypothetical protein BC643_2819 [Mangrovibacterium diazotrophicum]